MEPSSDGVPEEWYPGGGGRAPLPSRCAAG